MADTPRIWLQMIFSFFLGLMVTAFVGVGVYTFYPPPQEALTLQLQELDRREVAIRDSRPPDQLTVADRAQIQAVNEERNRLTDTLREARDGWARITSIVLIAFATLVMAVSLVGAAQLPVIGNGLLVGGVFTMVYGVGWIISTETSIARFAVMTVALAITLALGYVRFVRGRPVHGAAGDRSVAGGEGLAGLERRVQDLEGRLNHAASALGHGADR